MACNTILQIWVSRTSEFWPKKEWPKGIVPAKHELKTAVAELHNERIRRELLQEKCDWITFIVNVPSSSYMGGVWELQIWSVRSVLSLLL